jgi:FAD/FMN-containing dehydrogenase
MDLVVISIDQLAASLPQAKRVNAIDLHALNRVVEYTPEDLTVTAQAGITLTELQAALGARGQWLPIDPPRPASTTIWDVLKFNLSGPRRYGFGTIREHLIGIRVVLADGRVIRSGGRVVKNIAGYDLLKLFVGDHGSLGVPVEATFKVQPRPEAEAFLTTARDSLSKAGDVIQSVLGSAVTPCVLDLYRLANDSAFHIVVGFAGTREEVDWSVGKTPGFGLSDLRYAESFSDGTKRVSVLPSRLIETITEIAPTAFIARAGNGVVYYTGGKKLEQRLSAPQNLMRRVKDAFDPKHILPDLPW